MAIRSIIPGFDAGSSRSGAPFLTPVAVLIRRWPWPKVYAPEVVLKSPTLFTFQPLERRRPRRLCCFSGAPAPRRLLLLFSPAL